MSFYSNNHGAALVEYIALLGLIGVVSIVATVELGGTVKGNFAGVSTTFVENGLIVTTETVETATAQPAGPFLSPLEAMAATPYAPDRTARDPLRFYEEFVVIRVEQGGAPYVHSWGFADDHNPGEIVSTPPSSFVGAPFAATSNPAALCVEASMNLGTIMDPAETFFPGISPSLTSESQIEVEEFVAIERTSDETGLNETSGFATVPSVGVSNGAHYTLFCIISLTR